MKIALVRLSALGDVVLCSALIDALSRQFPHAHITWITQNSWLPLFRHQPWDNVTLQGINKPKQLKDYWHFYQAYKDQSFDILLCPQASARVNLLYPCLRAQRKIGYAGIRARDGQSWLTNEQVPDQSGHLLDGFYQFLTHLGAQVPTEAHFPIGASMRVRRTLPASYVVINPSASKPERNWPKAHYQAIIAQLQQINMPVVLTGGNQADEMSLAQQLHQPGVINLCGQTDLLNLSGVLKDALWVLSPDTGPLHIARAHNTPVIGLYAVARPELSGPYQAQQWTLNRYPQACQKFLNQVQPDWHTRVHHPQAMSLITPEMVWAQIQQLSTTTTLETS